MNRTACCTLLAALLMAQPTRAADTPDDGSLKATIAALDVTVFDAYNRCDLVTFGRYFSPTVEFYHDNGGATFDRETVLANTRKYICGKVHRDLVPSTLRVYPIKDFGAIEEGEHRFCELSSGNCDGIAKFVIVWKAIGDGWQITRVLSYGHRAMTDSEKSQVPSTATPSPVQ